jgi:hypothetical protein
MFLGFALYKALLRRVPRAPFNQLQLREVIRREFRKDAGLEAHKAIKASIQSGYDVFVHSLQVQCRY